MAPSASETPQVHRQRLVVIVLPDDDDTARAVARRARPVEVLHARERGLLDEHVLAGGERLEGQRQVIVRRHGDHDRVDAGSLMAAV